MQIGDIKIILVDDGYKNEIFGEYCLTLNKIYYTTFSPYSNPNHIRIYDDNRKPLWIDSKFFKTIEDIRDDKINSLFK